MEGWWVWEVGKGRRVVRLDIWERWECGEVGNLEKVGERWDWEVGKGGKVVRLERWEENKEAGCNCHWNCMYLLGIVVRNFKCRKMGWPSIEILYK